MKHGTFSKKSFLVGVLVTSIVFTSVGALSTQSVLDSLIEIGQRRYRDMNNQDMWGTNPDGTKNAAWYFFEGRIQARTEDLAWLLRQDPETANLLQP